MNTSEHTYGLAPELFGSWNGPAIGLMDLDAFFASVEQLDHPEWRGKPVIVGGSPEKRGVVSTCSYEARVYGVRSAMSSAQAKRLCPEAIWTPGHFDRYREMSARVMAILADETPFVDRVSIDEAFFDISPGRFCDEHPIQIAQRISRRVSELGVTCSIGLGRNKTVAKIASERDKPRGLTIVTPGTERGFLAPLPVRAMSGIGAAAESALARVGIRTLGQLADASDGLLSPIFGINAELVRRRAAGLEVSEVRAIDAPDDVKSVSNERTFAHDLTDPSDVKAAIQLLSESVGARLRRRGLAGRTVTLKLKYSFGEGRTIGVPWRATSATSPSRSTPCASALETMPCPLGEAPVLAATSSTPRSSSRSMHPKMCNWGRVQVSHRRVPTPQGRPSKVTGNLYLHPITHRAAGTREDVARK